MATPPQDDGLRIVSDVNVNLDKWSDDGDDDLGYAGGQSELETLRDEFVDGFNARDLEAVLALVHADVECPDIRDDGAAALAEELEAIWERSPVAILTRGFLDDSPCAVAWLPDEAGCWARAAVVCFDAEDGLINLVELPDDADALERATAEEPTGEELDEWSDWSEWDQGEETGLRSRS